MSPEASSGYDDQMRQAVRSAFAFGDIPTEAQAKLKEAYVMLDLVPQDGSTAERPEAQQAESAPSVPHVPAAPHVTAAHGGAGGHGGRGVRTAKRGLVIAVAAVIVALLGCTAYAASRLLQVGPNDAGFFSGGNLPVYNSLEPGTASLSADVGESRTAEGTTFTLDTVSCDRSIINLFFTIQKDGGFDLDSLSNYEGSNEDEWTRLQKAIPRFRFEISSNGEKIDEGGVRSLDAYMEDGQVKCLLRIVPKVALPDQVDIALKDAYTALLSPEAAQTLAFDTGLDLSTVKQPEELGAQDIVFPTAEGDKTLSIERFTQSDFGTVLVAKNPTTWLDGGKAMGVPDDAIDPRSLKITDDKGNVLNIVEPGDGMGNSPSAPFVFELSGSSGDISGITFTPMLTNPDLKAAEEARDIETLTKHSDENTKTVDISQIGTKLPTSEFGGYEIAAWDVKDRTVSITLKPYGWIAGSATMIELNPVDDVTILWEEFTGADGKQYTGGHTAMKYQRNDLKTGDVMQITSYYAASDEELEALHQYRYHALFNTYVEDTAAAQTLTFQ